VLVTALISTEIALRSQNERYRLYNGPFRDFVFSRYSSGIKLADAKWRAIRVRFNFNSHVSWITRLHDSCRRWLAAIACRAYVIVARFYFNESPRYPRVIRRGGDRSIASSDWVIKKCLIIKFYRYLLPVLLYDRVYVYACKCIIESR